MKKLHEKEERDFDNNKKLLKKINVECYWHPFTDWKCCKLKL